MGVLFAVCLVLIAVGLSTVLVVALARLAARRCCASAADRSSRCCGCSFSLRLFRRLMGDSVSSRRHGGSCRSRGGGRLQHAHTGARSALDADVARALQQHDVDGSRCRTDNGAI
jgi:hypothetical protein